MSVPRAYRRTFPCLSQEYKDIERAGNAVNREKKHGRMLPATAYPCVICMNSAREYHHASYLESDWLCVIPMCRTCHHRHHRSGLALPPLGVIALKLGLVRIAISSI